MKNISIVQAIIFSLLGLAIIFAVFIFAFNKSGQNNQYNLEPITIWGTISYEIFDELLDPSDGDSDPRRFNHVTYVEKKPETIEREFTNALAEREAPDLILLRENQIVENEKKLVPIPFENLDIRSYKDTFIPQAELLIKENEIIGIPFSINPLILYYNEDLLNSNGLTRPPKTWAELLSISENLTVSDSSFNISKSAIAMGNFSNIKNAKEILWTLVMQTGNDIVKRSKREGQEVFVPTLLENSGYSTPPANAAVNFFNQFANPARTVYSWNGSLPESINFFLAGNMAFYLGFADEMQTIKQRNPNLNFEVAEIPQSSTSEVKKTYGKMYFLGIVNGVDQQKISSAYQTALLLSSAETQTKYSNLTGLPPVRRDLLSKSDPSNSYDVIFRNSALFTDGVLEPNENETNLVVERMIRTIQSGEQSLESAISLANQRLEALLNK